MMLKSTLKIKNPTKGSGFLEGFLAKKRAEKATSLIPKSYTRGRILDVGCGQYPYFLLNIKFTQKYGIDPSVRQELVDEKIILNKTPIGTHKFPYIDNFFDVITMLAVFEHIDKDKLNFALGEILRVLKHEGILAITTPSPWSDKLLHQMAKFGFISSEEIHDHKSHYDMNTIVDIIKQAGFDEKNIKSGYFELGFNMWFTAKK